MNVSDIIWHTKLKQNCSFVKLHTKRIIINPQYCHTHFHYRNRTGSQMYVMGGGGGAKLDLMPSSNAGGVN